MLAAMINRQTAAIHAFSEKNIVNITATVAATLTMSGMVCAMNPSTFSMFWSMVFFIAPVDVPLRKPSGSLPIWSASLTLIPKRML